MASRDIGINFPSFFLGGLIAILLIGVVSIGFVTVSSIYDGTGTQDVQDPPEFPEGYNNSTINTSVAIQSHSDYISNTSYKFNKSYTVETSEGTIHREYTRLDVVNAGKSVGEQIQEIDGERREVKLYSEFGQTYYQVDDDGNIKAFSDTSLTTGKDELETLLDDGNNISYKGYDGEVLSYQISSEPDGDAVDGVVNVTTKGVVQRIVLKEGSGNQITITTIDFIESDDISISAPQWYRDI